MPHLSPMNWSLAPILFTLSLLPLVISLLWWSQSPNFPMMNIMTQKSLTRWNWS